MPPRPKPTQMPLDWPPYYPNHLIPQTAKVVAEAVKKFPEQTQITELCESVVSTLTPHFCAAVQGKTLRADLALYRMSNLLDCLLAYNCDDPSERYRLKKKVVNSDEWKKLVDEIARVPIAGRPQGQPVETTGHKDAKHPRKEKKRKKAGRKTSKAITDRNNEIATLLASGKTLLEIAKHLDARRISVPDSWVIVEDDDAPYQVRNFEKAYKIRQLRKKMIDLVYGVKKSHAKVVGKSG